MKKQITTILLLSFIAGCTPPEVKAPIANKKNCSNINQILETITLDSERQKFEHECKSHNTAQKLLNGSFTPSKPDSF